MTTIQERLASGKGKFTTHYPDLGTAPVSYEDCVSPEWFQRERKAIFERSWLCVGRDERLPGRARSSPVSCPTSHPSSSPRRWMAPCMPSTTCAPTVATRWCGRSIPRPSAPVLLGRSPASTTAGAMTSRARSITSPTSRILRSPQEPARHAQGALRGFCGIRLRRPRRVTGAAAGIPRGGILELEAYPFHLMTQRYGSRRGSTATGSSRLTRSVSGTTRRTCTADSSIGTCRRRKRWCRRWMRTTTTCSRRTC